VQGKQACASSEVLLAAWVENARKIGEKIYSAAKHECTLSSSGDELAAYLA
jgi:hypothetical protein